MGITRPSEGVGTRPEPEKRGLKPSTVAAISALSMAVAAAVGYYFPELKGSVSQDNSTSSTLQVPENNPVNDNSDVNEQNDTDPLKNEPEEKTPSKSTLAPTNTAKSSLDAPLNASSSSPKGSVDRPKPTPASVSPSTIHVSPLKKEIFAEGTSDEIPPRISEGNKSGKER